MDSSDVKKALGRVNVTLGALREIDPIMPIQTAHVFTVIAAHPGISMQKLGTLTGLAQSSCSRNVAALTDWHRAGKEGYGLVERIEDPQDRRTKRMFLTEKGWDRIREVLQVDSLSDMPTAANYERAVRGGQ